MGFAFNSTIIQKCDASVKQEFAVFADFFLHVSDLVEKLPQKNMEAACCGPGGRLYAC